ncbi:MAG: SpoIID/LytB domain-containing protein [Nitrospirota bacterium]
MKFFPALALIAVLMFPAVSFSETVRVLVMDNLSGLTLDFPEGFDLKGSAFSGLDITEDGRGGKKITLGEGHTDGIRINTGDTVININEFSLSGDIEIKKNAKGLYRIINELDLEDYTRAVVGEEMSSKWPIEALKAQAVIARTYVMYKKKTSATACDYDLCSTINSQMFTGSAREKEGPALAAKETRGQVLGYDGAVIEAVYHSTCGGSTEDASDVWDRDYPYLKARECAYCQDSPYSKWKRTLSAGDIERALSAAGFRTEDLTSIKILKRSRTGRVKLMRIIAGLGSRTLKGIDFRKVIGFSKLPSTLFEVSRQGDTYTFLGRGSGHGVGLCQFGAKSMAEKGKDYREILGYYYPGTTLSMLVSDEERKADAP